LFVAGLTIALPFIIELAYCLLRTLINLDTVSNFYMDKKEIVKKHPLAIRWFHWINFPVLAIMIWSGLLIYWANDVYKIGFGSTTLLKFFPNSFYQALNIPYRLSEGMAYHFVFMWLFFLNGIAYVLYTAISGEWRLLMPNRSSFKEAWQVLLHDLHIRKTAPVINGKYNSAQRIAYTAIIIMGIGSILTGLAIYKPVQLGWLCSMFGGYKMARIIHFALTIGYVLFFLVHIFQVIKAGWNNFRAMVTGFEVHKTKENLPGEEAGTPAETPVK
jgi:thiosulfate reductase cytochrome b subunit